jgi:hypothetical protein
MAWYLVKHRDKFTLPIRIINLSNFVEFLDRAVLFQL